MRENLLTLPLMLIPRFILGCNGKVGFTGRHVLRPATQSARHSQVTKKLGEVIMLLSRNRKGVFVFVIYRDPLRLGGFCGYHLFRRLTRRLARHRGENHIGIDELADQERGYHQFSCFFVVSIAFGWHHISALPDIHQDPLWYSKRLV
jgi:hypothetical protein